MLGGVAAPRAAGAVPAGPPEASNPLDPVRPAQLPRIATKPTAAKAHVRGQRLPTRLNCKDYEPVTTKLPPPSSGHAASFAGRVPPPNNVAHPDFAAPATHGSAWHALNEPAAQYQCG